MAFKPEQLLDDAIEAARRALRDLEADQIAASIHRVAGYRGGKLPPPFARSLLMELEVNEFLRSKALEAWDGARPAEGDGSLASYVFLERGPGWILDLAAVAYKIGGKASAAIDRTLEVERDAFQAEVISLKQRLKTARKEQERLEKELKEALRAGREPNREQRVVDDRLSSKVEELAHIHAAEVEDLETRLEEALESAESARVSSRSERRLRAEAEAAHRAALASDSGSIDPGTLVERLDQIAAAAEATVPLPRPDVETGPAVVTTPLEYPSTIRPDSADAIEWLVDVDATVLVDGYNVGFELADRLDPSLARRLASEAAGRLAGAAPQGAVVVVFDSEIAVDDSVPARTGPFEVVFSAGRSADDEIVDRVGGASNPVVISNDREVRSRAESAGAVALWADSLVEWGRRR